ncbi:hypothetical protein FB446DRAFT_801885 [Lentinula raphanica]|nr:hypothetical protein FB446DRAFT_801885 [Lentinula raphanica]
MELWTELDQLHATGGFNEWRSNKGFANTFPQPVVGLWSFAFMYYWPTCCWVNVWGQDSYFYSDTDGDGVLDRLTPNSAAPDYLDITMTWYLELHGRKGVAATNIALLVSIPFITGTLAVLIFMWLFYGIKVQPICSVFNISTKYCTRYVQFGNTFNSLHAAVSSISVHQSIGVAGAPLQHCYSKRSPNGRTSSALKPLSGFEDLTSPMADSNRYSLVTDSDTFHPPSNNGFDSSTIESSSYSIEPPPTSSSSVNGARSSDEHQFTDTLSSNLRLVPSFLSQSDQQHLTDYDAAPPGFSSPSHYSSSPARSRIAPASREHFQESHWVQ